MLAKPLLFGAVLTSQRAHRSAVLIAGLGGCVFWFCVVGLAFFGDRAVAAVRVPVPAPATQVHHLAGFQAHDVGLAPYGTFARDRGPGAGGAPSKKTALEGAAQLSPGAVISRPGLSAAVRVGAEIPASRTALSRTFEVPNGGYVARIYARPVNYRASDGSMQPIDDTLVASGAGFANRADSTTVSLPRTMAAGPIRVSGAGGSVSMQLEGAGARAASVSGATASYEDVLPGVSLTYDVSSGRVKEAIALASASATASFRFDLGLSSGLVPTLAKSGVTEIRDAQGALVFTIPAATMSDSGSRAVVPPATGGPVAVRLDHAAQGWVLTLTPDAAYLHATGRQFPVIVDPTIDSLDTTECSLFNGASAGYSYCQYYGTGAGTSGATQIHGVLALPLSAAIPADSQVLSAQLKVDVNAMGSSAPFIASAYGLTRGFTSQASWNNYDGVHPWTTPGGDRDPNPASSITLAAPGWVSFPITALVQSWLDGSRANDGVMLASDPAVTNYASFFGVSSSTPPYLEVSYVPRLGEPRAATINRTTLTDRMSLGVNVANGNLLVHNRDLAISGAGLNQVVDRTYNNLSPYDLDFGYGWTSSAGREPVLSGPTDGINPINADGSVTYFASDGHGGYITPPGVDATLCSAVTLGGCPGLPSGAGYLMTYRDGTHQSFDGYGGLLATTDQNQNQLSDTFSGPLGTQVSSTDTQGRTLSFTPSGTNVAGIADNSYPGGRNTGYVYVSGELTTYTDPAGNPTYYSYDSQHNLKRITDPSGNITSFTFDTSNRVKTILRVTNPTLFTGDTTSYSYNASSTAMPGNPGGCPAVSGVVAYQQTVVTDPKGNLTYYCYDTHDRVYFVLDALGHQRQSTYSTDDNVVKFNDPTGATVTTAYDTTDRSCAGIEPPSAVGQDPVAQHVDFLSVPASETVDPCLNHSAPPQTGGTHPYYPDFGRDPQGHESDLGYDASNNLSSIVDHASSTGVHLNYNANGTVNWSRDGNGNQTNYGYFAAGDPNGHPGDLKSVTPPGPLGASSYTYDAVSRIHTYTDGKGQTTTFLYDKQDRVTEVDYADGSSIKTTYDNSGNTLQTVDSVNGTSTYTPDAKNRIISEALATGKTNTYGYDANDNLHTVTDASGTTTYGYDPVNDNTTVLEPGASTPTTLAYDANDRNTCITHPNGIIVQDSYLPGGELTRTTALKVGATCATAPTGANQLTDQSYSYKTGTSDTQLRQTLTALGGATTTYSYDTLNRLTEASASTGDDRKYTLDGAGNITSRIINAAPTTMTYNAANQICWASSTTTTNTCATAPSGATTYTFDPNGNELANSAGLTLAYNARNQTTNITSGGTANPLGYLGGGQSTLTAMGSTSILNDLLGISGQTTGGQTTYDTRDIHSNLLHQRAPSGTYTYLQDGLGSVVGLADASGSLVNTSTYDPYGQATATTGTTPNPFSYASGLKAPAGLVKYGARYYDPSLGRWTQPDPLADGAAPNATNPYAYVAGDPLNVTDPSGLCFIFSCDTYHKAGDLLSKGQEAAAHFAEGPVGGALLGCVGTGAEYLEGGIYTAAAGCIAGGVGGYFGVDLAEGISHAHQNRPGG